MRYYLNDASIQQQFAGLFEELFEILVELAVFRSRFLTELGELYITESLREKKINSDEVLIKSIRKFAAKGSNRDKKRFLLSWIESADALDYDHIHIDPDEKFYLGSINLQKSALSVASKQICKGLKCSTFSLKGGKINYCYTPLIVSHFNIKGLVAQSSIANYWEIDELEMQILGKDQINSWESMVEFAQKHFRNLEFGNFFANSKKLNKGNFSKSAQRQISLVRFC